MNIIIGMLISILIFNSCSQINSKKNINNTLGGITKRIFNFDNNFYVDSVFDQSNQLRKVISYFDTSRIIKEEKYFKNGVPDSFYFQYHHNGFVKSKRFFYEGKERFERIDYLEDGNVSEYLFLNYDQTKIYLRIYDKDGKCKEVRGTPFFECFILPNGKASFSTKDTLVANFYAPTPPDCNTEIFTVIGEEERNNIYKRELGFKYGVKIYPLELGSYEWDTRMKLIDKKNDSVIFCSELKNVQYVVK